MSSALADFSLFDFTKKIMKTETENGNVWKSSVVLDKVSEGLNSKFSWCFAQNPAGVGHTEIPMWSPKSCAFQCISVFPTLGPVHVFS